MNNGAYILLLSAILLSLVTSGSIKNGTKIELKRTGATNSELIERLDYYHSLGRDERPSYLQMKYAANEYPYLADESYPDDTSDNVNMQMRDIVGNGFTSVLSVGSNRQEFYCIFDTGSSVMFLNSFGWDVHNCELNPQFDPSVSETAEDLGYSISLTYGGGFWDGYEISDTVWLHDLEVPGQTIALITDEDSASTINFSCIIGLSYPNLAPNGELLFFDNIIEQGLLEENVFTTFYYQDEEHADLSFGYIDPDYYTGDITWVDVQIQEHWNIPIDDVKIDGVSLGFWEHTCQGLVDSGTNLLSFEYAQMDIIDQYIHHMGSCDNFEGLPVLTYTISGVDFDLYPEDYYIHDEILPNVWSPGLFPMDVFNDMEHPSMVIGVLFSQRYFTIYDRDNDRVGFALSNPNVQYGEDTEVDRIPDNSSS